ncbi:MAG: RagB/SusD family nutrient uptake outer membrane protein [Muribaculaceae bacterium]|nr:RagB/SusD family nutrient uptake outer membrane protein [Muribaculaceae bacterium]
MKFLKNIALIGAFGLPLVGCSDFLEEDNKSSANEDGNSYIETNPDVLKATAFDQLKSFVADINMQDLTTDLFSNWRATNNGPFSLFSFTSDDGTVTNYYKNVYTAINYANAMIKFGGSDTKIGMEGRFLRGLCYYYLTQQYGGVPYVTEYIMTSSRDYPRDPLADVYSAVVRDLTEVYNSSVLPDTDHNGHVSKQAVAALIAKIELAAGWDIDTQLNDAAQGTYTVNSKTHFTEAARWAELAINNTKLTMSFEQKWSPTNEDNDEVIFTVNYLREGFPGDEATGGHSLQNNYTAYAESPTQTGQKCNGSGGQNQPSDKALLLWGPGDSRWDGTFMTTCYNASLDGNTARWGTEGYYAYYNCTPDELSKLYIAARFFPYYTTDAEVETYITDHKNQTVKSASYGIKTPYAVILRPDVTTLYSFNENGSATKTTPDFSVFVGRSLNSPSVKKFDDPASIASNGSNDYRNIVLLHVSQMYLVAAEAYLMAGDEGKAIAKINEVRARAGAPQTSFAAYPATVEYLDQANTPNFTIRDIDLVLDELARETYAERTRYADLRRTKQLVRYNLAFSRDVHSVAEMSNANGEIKWYRPIPQLEIDSNTGMTIEDQNPGY